MQLDLLEVKGRPFRRKLAGCVEVGLMVLRETQRDKPLLDTPEASAAYYESAIRPGLVNPDVEQMHAVFVNTRRRAVGHVALSLGTGDTLLVAPSVVFRAAIVAGAAGIILFHNHPSGDPTPSEADIKVTRDLIRGGQILKVEVLDHLVMGEPGKAGKAYCSLRELGYFMN